MCDLLLGIRVSLFDFQKVPLSNVNFEKKVEDFKDDVAEVSSIPKDRIEPPKPAQQTSEHDIQALVFAFKALTLNSCYKHVLHRLARHDVLENLISTTPGLSQDPVAISIIQDPDLMLRMGNVDTVRRIFDLHPALAEAANNIAPVVHEEAISRGNSHPSTSYYNNFLEMLSEEEDMESSESGSRSGSVSQITAAQLAAALASASQATGNSSSTDLTSSESASAAQGIFTQEMLQRAIANATTPNSSASRSGNNEDNGGELVEQMRQMRELGLTDDALNLQALQRAGGNVHAAVELIFSGDIFNS